MPSYIKTSSTEKFSSFTLIKPNTLFWEIALWKININRNVAAIEGNTKFIGAELMSSDLRASVSLVLAAMVSKGRSTINRIYHLDRGYEGIENKLKKIGVRIRRQKNG